MNRSPQGLVLEHWIPLLTTDAPVAKGAAKQSLLGTTRREDGTMQVTYKHRAIYTWTGGYGIKGDKKPGDVTGPGRVRVVVRARVDGETDQEVAVVHTIAA